MGKLTVEEYNTRLQKLLDATQEVNTLEELKLIVSSLILLVAYRS